MAQPRDALGRYTVAAVMTDEFSKPIGRLGRLMRGLIGIARRVGQGMQRAFRGFFRVLTRMKTMLFNIKTLFLGAFGVAVIRQFVKFEAGLTQVATLTDFTRSQLRRMGDDVLAIGRETGDSFDSLNKSLFDLVSSGVEASKSTEVLRQAAKLAAGGGTETSVAVDGLTSILNAYGLGAEHAADVTDSMFQAMKGGKLTIAELSSNIGKVVSSAAKLDVSFDDVNAAVAALTLTGLSVPEATTALNSFFTALIKPVKEAVPLTTQLKEELKGEGGLVRAVETLGIASDELGDDIAVLFPNIRAMRGVFGLTANEGKNFTRVIKDMADKTGATEKAWQKVRQTLGNQLQRTLRTVQTLFIRIGEAAKPFIEEQLAKFEAFVGRMAGARARILTVVRTITQGLKDAANFIGTVVMEGDIPTLIISMIANWIVLITRLFIQSLPLLLKTIRLIGAELGSALVRTFVSTTKAELAKEIAGGQGPFSGILGTILDFLGVVDIDKLRKIGAELRGMDAALNIRNENIKRLQELRRELKALQEGADPKKLFGPLEILEKAGIMRKRLPHERGPGPTLPPQDVIDQQLAQTDFVKIAQKAVAQMEKALEGPINVGIANVGNKVFDDVDALVAERSKLLAENQGAAFVERVKGIREDVKKEAKAFMGEAGTLVGEAVDDVGSSLSDKSQAALDRLKQNVSGFAREFAEATAKDTAARFLTNLFNDFAVKFREAKANLDAILSGGGAGKGGGDKDKKAGSGGIDVTAGTGDVFTGFSEGIKQVAADLGDFNQLGQGIAYELGGALSDAFVSLFDDSKKSIKEWAGTFLKMIAKMIAQAVLFRAISSVIGLPGGGGSGKRFGGVIRRAFGGPVFGPSGRDVIPARLTRGEYVHRPEAVDYYGHGIMSAINRMAIPRELLRGMPRAAAGVHFGRGFAEGGLASSGGGDVNVLPVLSLDEQFMQMALKGGGKQVMLRFLREHKSEIEGFSQTGSER